MPGFSGINRYFSFRYQVRATLVLQNTPKLVPGCKIPIDSGIRGIPREGDSLWVFLAGPADDLHHSLISHLAP